MEEQDLHKSSLLIDVMFALTIAALFSGMNQHFGGIKIQLSDVLAAVTIFVAVLRGFTTPRIALPQTIFLVVYLLVVCVSAFQVGAVNGFKEVVQTILVFSFLTVLFGNYRNRSSRRLLVLSTSLILVVLAYNIGWHLSQGIYVGWKQLNEPKTIFTLLPILLILLFDCFGRQRRSLFVAASVIAVAIILLSGERKAYMFAVLALVIWAGARSFRYLAVATLIAPLLLVTAAFDETGYLSRQLGSFSGALTGHAELASTSELFDETRPVTLSDAQREFTQRIARSMWEEGPIFGIGTGGYAKAIEGRSSIPEPFRVGIHGEFYRVLYENGIVGLSIYSAYWIVSFVGVVIGWDRTDSTRGRNLNRIKLLFMMMFLLYCSSEAAKGLTLMCICSMPFILALRSRNTTAQSAQLVEEVSMRLQKARWTGRSLHGEYES